MSDYQWHMDVVATAENADYDAGTVLEEVEYGSYREIFEAFMNDLPATGEARTVYLKMTDDDGNDYTATTTGARLETFFKDADGNNGPMVPVEFQNEMQSVI